MTHYSATSLELKAAIAAYALIGVVTFGHSANERGQIEDVRTAECRKYMGEEAYRCDPLDRRTPFVALTSGVLWPLYWSWEAFDAIK